MKKIGLAVMMTVLGGAGLAQASETTIYTGVGLGAFELDAGKNKKTAIGGYGFVGADLHEYFSAEVRVGSTGKTDNADVGPAIEQTKADWFVSVLAKPKYEVMPGLTAYGLLGMTTLKASFTGVAGAKAGVKQTKTSTNFTFGVGGEYALSQVWSVGAEWARYATKADSATKNSKFSGLDVNGFTANVRYSF